MVVGGLGASQYVQDSMQQWSKEKKITVVPVTDQEYVGLGIRPCRILADD